MQTIEEYKAYTKQLEGEVKTWKDAYNAIVIERNQLLKQLRKGETMYINLTMKDVETIANKVETGGAAH